MNTNINYQPSTPLNFNLDFTKQRLRRNDTGLVAFDENLVTFKTTYQFTRFYAGYNDDINRRGFNPFTGQLEPGLHRNGRTFFIKMSYLFRRSFGGNG